MTYTRDEVRAARQTWIDYLRQPERKKATQRLVLGGEQCCCLGHACKVLDPEQKTDWLNGDGVLPDEMAEKLGMWEVDGRGNDQPDRCSTFLLKLPDGGIISSLTGLNDRTDYTPQQIGEYLATVIEGGDETPFRPLTEYSEG